MALQALSEFAGVFFVPGSSSVALSLKVKDFTHNFTITKKNRLVLQSLELQPDLIPTNITVTGKGDGCALVQVYVVKSCEYSCRSTRKHSDCDISIIMDV